MKVAIDYSQVLLHCEKRIHPYQSGLGHFQFLRRTHGRKGQDAICNFGESSLHRLPLALRISFNAAMYPGKIGNVFVGHVIQNVLNQSDFLKVVVNKPFSDILSIFVKPFYVIFELVFLQDSYIHRW